MRSSKDPRHIARIFAVMDLYAFYFDSNQSDKTDLDELEIGNYSKKLREGLVTGIKERYEEIDALIDSCSDLVKVSDLDLLLLQILRVGVYEGFIASSVPPKVAVDEAIELTRDFGIEVAVRRVSGILGKIFTCKVIPEEENKSPTLDVAVLSENSKE